MPFTVIEGSVLLFDANGNPLSVSSGDPLGLTTGLAVVGSDGANFRFIRTATDGTVRTDPTGTTAQPVSQATAGNLNATAVQGTAAALAGAWPVKVTDGTNTQPTGDIAGRAIFHKVTDGTNTAAVKAASTAAGATDPSLVVGLSPNSPLPSGSNTIGTVTLSGTDNTNGLIATAIKPVAGAAYSWTRFQNLGANVTLNVKASAGNLFSVYCQNNSTGTRYLQLFNTATTPGAGATPLFTFLVPGSGVLLMDSLFFGQGGYYFATGIAFAISTTQATYTAATATDHATHIMYV